MLDSRNDSFGALAGVCIALVFGKNVRLRRHDLVVIWSGVCGYAALVAAGFAAEQVSAAALAAVLLPALVGRAALHTRHALVLKRTQSQRPAPPLVTKKSSRELLKHGTHLVIMTLLLRDRSRRGGQPGPDPNRKKPVKV